MSEMRKTLVFCGVAIVLAALAVLTAPRRVTPGAFVDQGKPFFPQFTDPNAARTLEVIDWDAQTGTAVPFKVTYSGGIWTIPSQYNYPADAKDRLAQTAAGVIEIKKDDFRTDNVSDHEACGVIDPLDDPSAGLVGRGQRVTIKGENDVVLADLILGKPVEGREGMRFVRVPGQKRVYASRVKLDISTKFGDWIERDLLEADKNEIDNIILRDYSINERTGTVDERDVIVLEKHGEEWTMPGLKPDEEIVKSKLDDLLAALDDLKIEEVRPKPEGLTASLTRSAEKLTVHTDDVMSLQSKGYFFTKDGRLLSNEGEAQVRTNDGRVYALRFGEVVYGPESAGTPGGPAGAQGAGGTGENRYLFLTVAFDPTALKEPPGPPKTDFLSRPDSTWTKEDWANKEIYDTHERWVKGVKNAKSRVDRLNARFAGWYYVVSGANFEKLRPAKKDLVHKRKG
jgi:Domain of unknown function (DUF4340)